ncbi:hypothetical protein DRW41_18465 [Neobacillus piezotolerans]|uniref:Uncharacterized protein n=1 Tax=Neobacillus piezotolerans TaxID=2259171 RepID=A0A3D8GM53_9BACI|nr:hypothetical protein DRW41_18465 [Neobacillus piezotolerans]
MSENPDKWRENPDKCLENLDIFSRKKNCSQKSTNEPHFLAGIIRFVLCECRRTFSSERFGNRGAA